MFRILANCATLSSTILLGLVISTPSAAQQPGDVLQAEFSELAALFNAFDVTQVAMYEKLVKIGDSPDSQAARDQLGQTLQMQAEMKHTTIMPGMPLDPFGEFESDAMEELIGLLQSQHGLSAARAAFSNSAPLTPNAAAVIQRGREFEARLFDIYADTSISDKHEAIDSAVDDYLRSGRLAVPAQPKNSALLYGDNFASAFRTGYPELSGLNWTTQWLQFASMEALMLKGSADMFDNGVNETIERFENKLAGMYGIMVSKIPTEMPTAPAIAPLLYNKHPEAAVIIDNLNMLEAVIANILVHPEVQDRSAAMDAAVEEFTNRESELVTHLDYLLWSLRGGLYDQGGPALREITSSHRNRSRADMGMRHSSFLPPNMGR